MKRLQALLIALVGCLVLAGTSVVPALAAQPQGTLTAREYRLLSSAQERLTAALRSSHVNLNAVRAACRSLGSSTALLKTQREACLAETQLVGGLVNFTGEETRCGTASPHKYVCLIPVYAALAKAASAVYTTDVSARRDAVKRGFSGACLDALVNSSTITADERSLANSTEILSRDERTLAAVAKGQSPASAISISKFKADAKTFEADADRVLTYSSPSLSRCPHQP